jgi:hypothetical protein
MISRAIGAACSRVTDEHDVHPFRQLVWREQLWSESSCVRDRASRLEQDAGLRENSVLESPMLTERLV